VVAVVLFFIARALCCWQVAKATIIYVRVMWELSLWDCQLLWQCVLNGKTVKWLPVIAELSEGNSWRRRAGLYN